MRLSPSVSRRLGVDEAEDAWAILCTPPLLETSLGLHPALRTEPSLAAEAGDRAELDGDENIMRGSSDAPPMVAFSGFDLRMFDAQWR
jgi:hypothetical protein